MHSEEKTKIEFEIRRMGDCGGGWSPLLMASQSAGVFSLPPPYHSSRVHMHEQIYKLSTLIKVIAHIVGTLGFADNYMNNLIDIYIIIPLWFFFFFIFKNSSPKFQKRIFL